MKVVGIDPSLTGTGLCIVDNENIEVLTIPTTAPPSKDKMKIKVRHTRMAKIIEKIVPHLADADLIVIEGPAINSKMGSAHDRSGLWWMIVRTAIEVTPNAIVIEVTPTSRCKYATGKGIAGKDEVLLAVAKRYPDIDIKDNNQADAVILSAMGARLLGNPIDGELPQAVMDSMKKVSLDGD